MCLIENAVQAETLLITSMGGAKLMKAEHGNVLFFVMSRKHWFQNEVNLQLADWTANLWTLKRNNDLFCNIFIALISLKFNTVTTFVNKTRQYNGTVCSSASRQLIWTICRCCKTLEQKENFKKLASSDPAGNFPAPYNYLAPSFLWHWLSVLCDAVEFQESVLEASRRVARRERFSWFLQHVRACAECPDCS